MKNKNIKVFEKIINDNRQKRIRNILLASAVVLSAVGGFLFFGQNLLSRTTEIWIVSRIEHPYLKKKISEVNTTGKIGKMKIFKLMRSRPGYKMFQKAPSGKLPYLFDSP